MSLLLEALDRAADARGREMQDRDDRERTLPPAEPVAVSDRNAVAARRLAHNVFESKGRSAGGRLRAVLFFVAALCALSGLLALLGQAHHRQRDAQLRSQLIGAGRAGEQTAAAPTIQMRSSAPAHSLQPGSIGAPSGRSTAAVAQHVHGRLPAAAVTPVPEESAAPAAPSPASKITRLPVREPSIVRNGVRERIADALAAGYATFLGGDTNAAQLHYEAALRIDGRNRDALLGLGAVARRRGDDRRALAVYRTLLQQDPADAVAAAALNVLPGAGGEHTRELELKRLLHKDPGAAELHFALGYLYSGERRWGPARAAFFAAHRRDTGNPDFMFNLAVCLDHLNQTRAAREYYRKALRAADVRASGFDREAARARLRLLRGEPG